MKKQTLPDGTKIFHSEKNPGHTKKGPGRMHKQGGDYEARLAWWDLRKYLARKTK